MEKGTPVYDVELNKFLEQNPGKTEDDFQHPAISLHGRSLMLPTEVVGISEFHFPVQEVQHGEILGHHFVRLRVTIAGFGENSVQGWMYASDHILKGYEPQVGDDISGVFWMQGSMDKYPQFSAD
jgi:hypothetical protein